MYLLLYHYRVGLNPWQRAVFPLPAPQPTQLIRGDIGHGIVSGPVGSAEQMDWAFHLATKTTGAGTQGELQVSDDHPIRFQSGKVNRNFMCVV